MMDELLMNIVNRSESDSVSLINQSLKQWYAVYTIVRHEKSANSKLLEKGIETFLPLRCVPSRWSDRMKKIHSPLFPGYLFININPLQERLSVLNTRGVVRILASGANLTPIPIEQIQGIRTLLQSGCELQTDQFDLCGKNAIVMKGPLAGVRGRIIEGRGKFRLILSVDLIQKSVAAEVDFRDVQLI